MKLLLPFERTILTVVGASLDGATRSLFEEQLRQINKVQRILDWNEVEFYCMRWFKVRWPEAVLFKDKGEFILGSGRLSANGQTADVSVWSVGGHVFSIESRTALKPFKGEANASFTLSASAAQQGVPGDVAASRRRA